jgi:hypothetical protein
MQLTGDEGVCRPIYLCFVKEWTYARPHSVLRAIIDLSTTSRPMNERQNRSKSTKDQYHESASKRKCKHQEGEGSGNTAAGPISLSLQLLDVNSATDQWLGTKFNKGPGPQASQLMNEDSISHVIVTERTSDLRGIVSSTPDICLNHESERTNLTAHQLLLKKPRVLYHLQSVSISTTKWTPTVVQRSKMIKFTSPPK